MGYHLSLEGLRKGYLSKMVYFKKGKELYLRTEAPHIKLWAIDVSG